MDNSSYKSAGVDLEKYRQAMERLPRLMHRTFCPRVLTADGGFAGLFQLDFQNRLFARNYQEPVLVACTDGVGTKLKVAVRVGSHETVGIDLVAMCVNDAICCGAEPLFFLDYVAMSKDDPPLLEQIIKGISDGCMKAGCALLGGETAIMPDLYQVGDYDLAGFCVGVVERKHLVTGESISAGDKLLGLASSGIHSNGYSLVRRVVFDKARLNPDEHIQELGTTIGDALLTPTTIYVRSVRDVLEHYKVKNVVHGIAHITGGGLHENLERILPAGCRAEIQRDSWDVPSIFPWLQSLGDIKPDEMDRVFNMGIGLVLAVSSFYANSIHSMVQDGGIACWEIGEIVEGERGVTWA